GVSFVELAALVAPERRRHPFAPQQRGEWCVTAAHTLADTHHVWIRPDVIGAPPHPEPTESGHDLVEQQQDVIAIADLADGAPVVSGRPDQLPHRWADP